MYLHMCLKQNDITNSIQNMESGWINKCDGENQNLLVNFYGEFQLNIPDLIDNKSLKLRTVVLNSRDQQGKLWLLQFLHLQQTP